MNHHVFDVSPRGWGRVILWTICGTVLCVAVALLVDSFNFHNLSEPALRRAILIDIFVPMGLAIPILLFLTIKLRELAIANERLALYAATDDLTSVLNRAAFTSLVQRYLGAGPDRHGALLIIDADNFKRINDRFGHDKGDAALRKIAGATKGMLREGDVLGRIGGEEFGIFLPGASLVQAETVAERVRASVAVTEFVPQDERVGLTVSVGGAIFESQVPFSDLFRIADQQLYVAKRRGRNRVSIAAVAGYPAMRIAAA